MRCLSTLMMLCALGVSSAGFAAQQAGAPHVADNAAAAGVASLQKLRDFGADLKLLRSTDNLKIWATSKDGSVPQIIATGSDGGTLMTGLIYDQDGNNLTAELLSAEMKNWKPADAEAAITALRGSSQPACKEPGKGDNAAAVDIPSLRKFVFCGADIKLVREIHGLRVWVISKDRSVPQVAATTDSGRILLTGMIFDQAGNNVTQDVFNVEMASRGASAAPAAAAAPQPAGGPGRGERFLKAVEKAHWIPSGHSDAPVVYMVVDPHCGYSKAFWQTLNEQYVSTGKLQVRLLPTSIIGLEGSAQIAGNILGSTNALEKWQAVVRNDPDVQNWQPTAEGLGEVAANDDLAGKWKLPGTPFLVYRAGDGKVKLESGVLGSMDPILADLKTPSKVD